MAASAPAERGRLARLLRRLELAMGADRGERTLWVWVGPIATVVLTFGVLMFFGAAEGISLTLSVPMGAVMAIFMGALSAFYMAASSADEADAADEDPPTAGPQAPPPPPHTGRWATESRQPQTRPRVAGASPRVGGVRERDRQRDAVGGPRS